MEEYLSSLCDDMVVPTRSPTSSLTCLRRSQKFCPGPRDMTFNLAQVNWSKESFSTAHDDVPLTHYLEIPTRHEDEVAYGRKAYTLVKSSTKLTEDQFEPTGTSK